MIRIQSKNMRESQLLLSVHTCISSGAWQTKGYTTITL